MSHNKFRKIFLIIAEKISNPLHDFRPAVGYYIIAFEEIHVYLSKAMGRNLKEYLPSSKEKSDSSKESLT